MIETHQIQEGELIICHSDKDSSCGFLKLNGNQELEKHNRPVDEELVQLSGKSTIKLFNDRDMTKEIELTKGSKFTVPANQYHIHSNNNDIESITLWNFEGDIVNIIEKIRNQS